MSAVTENFPDISFIDDATVEETMNQMIADYQEKYKELTGKDVSLGQADPYRLIMYACTMQLYQAMQYADYAGKMSFLKYASGKYLDNLAALRGITRLQASAASTVLRFSIETAYPFAVAIPLGCRVTNGNDLFFATDEYAEIKVGEQQVTVTATCTQTGVQGNDFAPGELNIIVNTLPYVVTVENTVTTYGGADIEDDDSLRDRVYSVPDTYSTAGPDGAYEYFAKEADTSISDVVVQTPSPGEVVVYVICDGGKLPENALLQKVSDHLNDRKIRPLTDHVTIRAPEKQEYNIDLTYYIANSRKTAAGTIQAAVNTAIEVYNTWQTEKIGRDINPSYLIQKIMEAGAKRVDIRSPVHTVLQNNTIAMAGTVNVMYGGIEDD